MTSRLGPALFVGIFVLVFLGADDPAFVESRRVAVELKGKPKMQAAVRRALVDLFGPSPGAIKFPEGFALPGASGAEAAPPGRGLSLYRRHCEHCHGVSGDGDGPTAARLFPRPRDFRRGIFKFTSTLPSARPTRDDLVRTVRFGLHGTAMAAFDALLDERQVGQVVEQVAWFSARGEVEQALIDEATLADDTDPDPLPADVIRDVTGVVFERWKNAPEQVLVPEVPQPPATPESILRGKALFLGQNAAGARVECISCHGPRGRGDGPAFVGKADFDRVAFGGEFVGLLDPEARSRWFASLDDWGQPIRMFDLNSGLFKGGRRPIDLYRRIAKGINGARMPAHAPVLEPERIWDLVNFVLALPSDPGLLAAPTAPGHTVGPNAPAPSVTDHVAVLIKTFASADRVLCVAIAPDGATVAAGGEGNDVHLWDVNAARERQVFRQSGAVRSLAFSADGKRLAAGGADGVVVWDAASGEARATLKGLGAGTVRVAITPDGRSVAAVSQVGAIRLWDAVTCADQLSIGGEGNEFSQVAFSPDGQTLAAARLDGSIELWGVRTGKPGPRLDGHEGPVPGLEFSPDGATLASGGRDKSIRLWETRTAAQRVALRGHTNGIYSVTFGPDGRALVAADFDGNMKLWDLETGKVRATLGKVSVGGRVGGTPRGQWTLSRDLRRWAVGTRTEVQWLDVAEFTGSAR